MSATTFYEGWEADRAERLTLLAGLPPATAQIHRPDAAIELRLAKLDELPFVHTLIQAAFAEYAGLFDPSSGALRETLADVRQKASEGGAVLAWDSGKAVGTTLFALKPDHLYVGRLAVAPEQRGRGVASAILDYCETIARRLHCEQVGLGTRGQLESNVAIYQRRGYNIDKIVTHPCGTDQIVWLTKPLPSDRETV